MNKAEEPFSELLMPFCGFNAVNSISITPTPLSPRQYFSQLILFSPA
jgi:hypothetical protein